MKTKIFAFMFLLGLAFFFGCKNNDDDESATQTNTLQGTWHLRNVSGGFAGINVDFDRGEVKWTFNTSTGKLEVENNVPFANPDFDYTLFVSGTYNYAVTTSGDTKVLMIEGLSYGTVTVSDQTMTLDEQGTDGFLMQFER